LRKDFAQYCLCLLVNREIEPHFNPVFRSVGTASLENKAGTFWADRVYFDVRDR
jgi:hypothetical protein